MGESSNNKNSNDSFISSEEMSDDNTEFIGFNSKDNMNHTHKKVINMRKDTKDNKREENNDEKMETNIIQKDTSAENNKKENNAANSNNQKDETEKYKNNRYMPGDKGPYTLIVEKKGIIDLEIAEKLKSLNFGAIIYIKQFGKNRVKVQTRDLDTANKIINSTDLRKLHLYNAYIPNYILESIGYVNKIPPNANLEQMLENIKANAKVMKIERITRWNNEEKKAEPTPAVKITFRANTLPSEIAIYEVKRKVDYYVPKPIICRKCLIYGHSAKHCRGKEKCDKCGETEHNRKNCKNKTKCYYCGEQHITLSAICEEFKTQKKIKYLMVTNKISYNEARKTITPPEFKLNNEEFPAIQKNQGDAVYKEIEIIKSEMKKVEKRLEGENKKLQNQIIEVRNHMIEINQINRKIQAATQGYMGAAPADPGNDIILTEIIEQLKIMDSMIMKNYNLANDNEHTKASNSGTN